MENNDVIEILRYYRHNLMNQLQIIQGYLALGKMEKMQSKLSDVIDYYNEERNLINLNAPRFTIWVLRFHTVFTNIKLSYRIHIENVNLSNMDQQLTDSSQDIVQAIQMYSDPNELYEIILLLEKGNLNEQVELQFEIKGELNHLENFKKEVFHIDENVEIIVNDKENGIICSILLD